MNNKIGSNKNKKTIVIIGDWFIDENWIVSKHDSYASSHTGDIHYLAKNSDITRSMTSLCGTPEILVVLESFFNKCKEDDDYEFLSYGAWNSIDDGTIKCILCPEHSDSKFLTPYTIRSLLNVEETDQGRICPYEPNEPNEPKRKCRGHYLNISNMANKSATLSTNKIVRVYEGYGMGRPSLLRIRFDWQLPINEVDLDLSKLDGLRNKDVFAIIIEDHGKGVINDGLIIKIFEIIKNPKDVKWYVRSKIDNPTWLNKFKEKGIKIRLNVVDFKLAEYWQGRRKWTFGTQLSRASLEILGDLTGAKIYEHTKRNRNPRKNYDSDRAAILFKNNTAIAIEGNKCINLYDPPGPEQLNNIGRTTMFFTSLIAQDIFTKYTNVPFKTQCYNAMQVAFEWSKMAGQPWSEEKYNNALNYLLGNGNNKSLKVDVGEYEELWGNWNKSSTLLGTINVGNGKEEFQLWRGSGTLEKIICAGGKKRDAINDLLAKIHQFNKQEKPSHPFNCLLTSSPGWGKSYLARSMANYFDMHFLEFSISQMATTNDLIDCFDTICSAQNMARKKFLIFFDEINCEIQGHLATGLLLSPIWDGSFIRGGKQYKISPAVWVFASTETIDKIFGLENKGSDFVSRLNGPIIQLDKLSTELGEIVSSPNLRELISKDPDIDIYRNSDYMHFMAMKGVFRTDQVYLAISLLNSIKGPISRIHKGVLDLFHKIYLLHGIRSLEFFVEKFSNIQGGEIICSNVPQVDKLTELKRHVILPKEWITGEQPNNSEDIQFIEIQADAPPV